LSLDECLLHARTPLEEIQKVACSLKISIPIPDAYPSVRYELISKNLADEITFEAAKMIKEVYLTEPYTICGKRPISWIAAALFLAADQKNMFSRFNRITQETVAKIAGITSVTIRNRCKDFDRIAQLNSGAFELRQRVEMHKKLQAVEKVIHLWNSYEYKDSPVIRVEIKGFIKELKEALREAKG